MLPLASHHRVESFNRRGSSGMSGRSKEERMASPLSNPGSNPSADPGDAGHVPMTEEFDSFKHTMPSAGPVIIGMVLLAIAIGAAAYFLRATPVSSGSIDQAFAVNVPGQDLALATVQLSLTNLSKKPLFLKNVKITIRTGKGELSDDFGSVSDFERYFQAFPDLRQHSIAGLTRESRIAPGGQLSGSVVVSFPVTKESFDSRQGMTATVSYYDQPTIEIKR
jgi:hypothetical protein